MRVLTAAWLAMVCFALVGCARERGCFRDSLRSLEVTLGDSSPTTAAPRVRWALVSAACDHGIPTLLLASVALQESSFDPRARSPKGALGVLQVLPQTARETASRLGLEWRGEHSLSEPHLNAKLGAAYLRSLYQEFGDWEAALSAYNMGPRRFRDYIAGGKRASSAYAREILARWRSWEESRG